MRAILKDKLFLAQCVDGLIFGEEFRCFRPVDACSYEPYCDDFGPVNMSSVVHFIRQLDAAFAAYPDRKIVFCVDTGRRLLTNAVFLTGAYMILKHNMDPATVARCFEWMDSSYVVAYRDATFGTPDFHLHLIDCWRGLARGRALGWVRYSASGYMWGEIDIDEYRHYDHPANGRLHQVVPGKLIALQGPEELAGPDFIDTHRGRVFSPSFCADMLHDFDVKTVVRLNEPLYGPASFTASGMRHVDLPFADGACPPDAVVAGFLRAIDAAPGATAVHCTDGLGRTGTLIALYLMRSCGFGAREAMGWLRIMRPGSVLGEQQHFLCAVDAALQARRRTASAPAPGCSKHAGPAAGAHADGPRPAACAQPAPDAAGAGAALAAAAQVTADMLRRAAHATASASCGDAEGGRQPAGAVIAPAAAAAPGAT